MFVRPSALRLAGIHRSSRKASSISTKMSAAVSKIHDVAVKGFGEGTNDLYDAVRPSYPSSSLDIIACALPRKPLTVLEPGSGTGIFSRLLISPPPGYPALNVEKLVGIEPSGGMRAAWDRGLAKLQLGERRSKYTTVEGSFDDFSRSGVEKGQVDMVVIAQAWHWCPDYEAAMREIASYLSPGGALVLIWNLESDATTWDKDVRTHYERYSGTTPQYFKGWWRRCFEVDAYGELYEPAEEKSVAWKVGMTEDELVNRLLSKSYLTESQLSGQERTDFIKSLREIIRRDDKKWVDRDKGVFAYGYSTDMVIMRRKA